MQPTYNVRPDDPGSSNNQASHEREIKRLAHTAEDSAFSAFPTHPNGGYLWWPTAAGHEEAGGGEDKRFKWRLVTRLLSLPRVTDLPAVRGIANRLTHASGAEFATVWKASQRRDTCYTA